MPFSKEQFSAFLKSLNASGPEGFEGLIAKALEKLTGQTFHLAKSGSQRGRDISSNSLRGNVIAVECKRYASTTELNLRDLKGGLQEAEESIPDLDVWVLVTSRDVVSQVDESLRSQANEAGILYFSISDNEGISILDLLCANAIDVVLRYSARPEERSEIKRYLEDIAGADAFSIEIGKLRDQFVSPLIGYESWKLDQNQKLINCLKSASVSRSEFGQSIHVSDNARLVRREEAYQRLDEWMEQWHENDTPSPMFVVGEEGDGKTWCTVSWLSEKIVSEPSFPPVLFLSSEMVNSNEPLDLIAHVVEKKQGVFGADGWGKRIKRWVNNHHDTRPSILLVLDGINERRKSLWWRVLLEKLSGVGEHEGIATLVTCRQEYWRRYFEPLSSLQLQSCAVSAYNDEELSEALAFHNLQISDISSELLTLVRKPRYFDLMVKYREKIEESGDITAARLIYEDWRDRYERNQACPIDDEDFRRIICELAEKYRAENQYLRPSDIETLSIIDNGSDVLAELSSGGILRSPNSSGKYRVDLKFLVYGFGLLLVDELESFSESTGEEISNAIASWLEPHPEMDIKASICGFASLHALSLKNYPRKVKVVLLNAWLGSRNPDRDIEKDVIAYLPLDLEVYFDLSEMIWSDLDDNPWGQQLLMRAFLRWDESSVVQDFLQSRFERWLGFIPIYGHPNQRRDASNLGQNNRQNLLHEEINDRLGSPLEVNGQVGIGGYIFTGIEDDGLLRLGRVALAIISHLPRERFVRAIAIGLFAETLIDYPFKDTIVSWVLCSSSDSLWSQIQNEADCLANCGNASAIDAAYRLLGYEGSRLAIEKQHALDANAARPDPYFEQMRSNPCRYRMRWSREVCESCLLLPDLNIDNLAEQLKWFSIDPEFEIPNRFLSGLSSVTESINVNEVMIAMMSTSADHSFQTYEPVLCAYVPESAVSLTREVFRQAETREELPLRQLSVHISEHSLLLRDEEGDSIANAWRRMVDDTETWTELEITTECFLFKAVLVNTNDAYEQLQLSIERPEPCLDLIAYEDIFLPLPDWERLRFILESSADTKQTQRVLFFIASNAKAVPKDILETAILPLFEENDSITRACVLKLLYLSDYVGEISSDIIGEWCWSIDHSYQENYWGSVLLSVHGTHLQFSSVSSRVHPRYLDYALISRELNDDEILSYSQDISRWLEKIKVEYSDIPFNGHLLTIIGDFSSSQDFPMPRMLHSYDAGNEQSVIFADKYSSWGGESADENASLANLMDENHFENRRKANSQQMLDVIDEQSQSGNMWFDKRFDPALLQIILERDPSLSEQWLEYLNGEHKVKYLRLGGSFYASLCEAMFALGLHDKAVDIYKQVQSSVPSVRVQNAQSSINLLEYALFKAEANLSIQALWKDCLFNAKTNTYIIKIASLAWYGSGQDWLWQTIEDELDLSATLGKMRAGMLLSCIPSVDAFDRINLLCEESHEDSWLRNYFEKNKEFWQRNSWARHWFEDFWNATNDEQAWASFRLFLSCVDSRFWFWKDEIELETASADINTRKRRQIFYEGNVSAVKNRIKKNEKNLRKTYLRHKILKDEAWPWM